MATVTSDRRVQTDREIIGDIFTSDTSYQLLLQLCDVCGNRFAGSASERKAADTIAETMRANGLENVHLEPLGDHGLDARHDDAAHDRADAARVLDALPPLQPGVRPHRRDDRLRRRRAGGLRAPRRRREGEDRRLRRRDRQLALGEEGQPPHGQIPLGDRRRCGRLRLHQPEPRPTAHHRQPLPEGAHPRHRRLVGDGQRHPPPRQARRPPNLAYCGYGHQPASDDLQCRRGTAGRWLDR